MGERGWEAGESKEKIKHLAEATDKNKSDLVEKSFQCISPTNTILLDLDLRNAYLLPT